MTEDEWLESISVPAMLRFLDGRVRDEVLRHFIRASALVAWPELAPRWDNNSSPIFPSVSGRSNSPTLTEVAESANFIAVLRRTGGMASWAKSEPARQAQAALLREIVGNPFRTPAVNPHWLAWSDGTVAKMARSIHDEGAFDRLPILADALEDAGCTDRDILDHCRAPNEHVPGCWVLSLLLTNS